jgi:hypothetical protein
LIQTKEDAGEPMAMLGHNEMAFLLGKLGAQTIAVASLSDGRILRRLEGAKQQGIQSMAASLDGRTIYYATNDVWAMPATDGQPSLVGKGDRIAIDPRNGDLILERTDKQGVSLVRLSRAGDGSWKESPVPYQSDVPLYGSGTFGFGPRAVNKDGRMAVTTQPADFFFQRPAVLDLATGKLQMVPIDYAGSPYYTEWGDTGKIVAGAQGWQSVMWRFRPEKP